VRGTILFLFAAVLFAAPPRDRRTEFTFPVWAQENGSAALRPEEVKVRVDGKPVSVLEVRGPDADLMLLVVADLASDLTLAETARQALTSAVERLPSNIYLGLMRAQDGPRVILDPTLDRRAIAKAIVELPVSGHAALFDTVDTVCRIGDAILSKAHVRAAVLYVTDSNIRNYRDDYTNPVINYSDPHDMSRRFPEGLVKEKIARLETTLWALQAPLFIVHLDYRSERLDEAYQTGLMRLASATGGSSVFCRSRGEIPDAVKRMLETIAAHSSVVIGLPEKPATLMQLELASPAGAVTHRQRFGLGKR
jgi:hypothetical protein